MLYLPPYLVALCAVLAFIVGACVGSFVNCAALRRGSGESALRGRSHCPTCGHTLGAGELIPIVSWFAQGKKCKHCDKAISGRYPATEAILGFAYAAVVVCNLLFAGSWFFIVGTLLSILESFIFYALLLYVSLVDIDSRTVPNGAIIAMLVVHLLYLVLAGLEFNIIDFWMALQQALIGAFGLFVPLLIVVLIADKVFGRESMGGGDLKLFFVGGFYFGWARGLLLVILACIFGIIGAIVTQRSHEDESLRRREIPFGPAIALACVFTDLFGSLMIAWYMGLF